MSQSITPPDDARDSTPAQESPPAPGSEPPPRLRRPDRQQLLIQPRTVDDLVPEDHPVRTVWALVHRWETLEKDLEAARAHLEAVKRAAAEPAPSPQQRAARERAARERRERLERALVEMAKLEEAKAQQKDKPSKPRPPRASSTDPE